jgi:hypothetical protein
MTEGVGFRARELERVDEPRADFADAIELGLLGALIVAHDVQGARNAKQISNGVFG